MGFRDLCITSNYMQNVYLTFYWRMVHFYYSVKNSFF